MRYRVGRHNPQLVYAQSGDEPHDKLDTLIATCFTWDMAALIVEALIALPVEESTPLDSPPRSELVGMLAKHIVALNKLAVAAEAYLTRTEADDAVRDRLRIALFDATTDAWLLLRPNVPALNELVSPPDMRSRRQGGRGAAAGEVVSNPQGTVHNSLPGRALPGETPAGEVVSVPPPAPARVDERGPVPPPVDALLKLLDEYSDEIEYGTAAESACDSHTSALYGVAAKETRDSINRAIKALWATGVEEGRRRLDAEIHADVFTSARLAAAEAGFGPAPESVTVSYDVTTDPQTAFDLGVAEGRRQATEELTKERESYGRLALLYDAAVTAARRAEDGCYQRVVAAYNKGFNAGCAPIPRATDGTEERTEEQPHG